MPTTPAAHLEVDVLVVGAGPSGLATAISTARHGGRVLLIERHAGLSNFPKATGVRPRVMEILRSWGLEESVRAASQDARLTMRVTPMLAVPGTELSLGLPDDDDLAAVSPSHLAVCPQDRLEGILLAHLQDDPRTAEVRFGHELCDVETSARGVVATVQGPHGLLTVAARFLVGADGARSRVRAAAGIEVVDLGSEGHHLSTLFRADLSGLVAEPPHVLTATVAPGLEGTLVATGEPDRWSYDLELHPEQGETPADWTDDRIVGRLRAVTGRPDLRAEILGRFPWDFGAAVAAQQRKGPVFLVGDAAHRTTPRGATGMNTGIADGHNLGWKLAWVARGIGGPALLDSYEQERGPVGRANAEASLVTRMGASSDAALDQDFGASYASAIVANGSPLAGRRAPHVWVQVGGERRSTVDLFDGRLTLVTGPAGDEGWLVCQELAASGTPVAAYRLGSEVRDDSGRLSDAYLLGTDGCVLVRPDGYVAWAGSAIDVRRRVQEALGR